MERATEHTSELDRAQATEAWFREFIFDDEVKAGRISQLSASRLKELYGTGRPADQMRRAADAIFKLDDVDKQATFAMYLCGYGDETIANVAIGDIDETLQDVRELIGPKPEKRQRAVGQRAVRAAGESKPTAPKPAAQRANGVTPRHRTAPARSRTDEASAVFTDDDETDQILQAVRLSDDPVKDYLQKIGKHELLKADDEVRLAQAIEVGLFAEERLLEQSETLSPEEVRELKTLMRAGQRANEQMINSNLRLVVSIAKRYTGRGMLFLDLIQEGNLGLDHAVKMFNYEKGFKFSTYATWWIRQAITRSLGDQSRTIRLPVHMHEKIMKMSRATDAMERDLGRPPTDEELAHELEINVEKLFELRRISRIPISLNMKIGEDAETEFGDLVPDTNASPVDDDVTDELLKRDMAKLIEVALDAREQRLVRMRFGIEDGTPRTLDEVGEALGVSRERIRQIESRAMKKLRAHGELSTGLSDYLSA